LAIVNSLPPSELTLAGRSTTQSARLRRASSASHAPCCASSAASGPTMRWSSPVVAAAISSSRACCSGVGTFSTGGVSLLLPSMIGSAVEAKKA
jgi:hypothetical protein